MYSATVLGMSDLGERESNSSRTHLEQPALRAGSRLGRKSW